MKTISEIKSELSEEWGRFENLLSSALQSDINLLNKIDKYLLDNSGKKLRPLLVLATAKACSGFVNDLSVACAAVSELIHTATLLHDDVVDDSDLRRGALTVKSLFSPGASVLVGDYWLSKAIHVLIDSNCDYRIMSLYAKTIEDLASGEMIQMERAENLGTGRQDYFEVIRCKTASLFVSSVRSAAIASKASPEVEDALGKYALNLGICFQIRDDILDYSPSDKTGKDSDSDITEKKITLPLMCALEADIAGSSRILQLISEVDVINTASPSNLSIVAEVKNYVTRHDGVASARTILQQYVTAAIDALSILPPSSSRDTLCDIASAMAQRC